MLINQSIIQSMHMFAAATIYML